MDVQDLGVTWSHTYTSDDIIEVPGFTVSLPSIFSAGVYVQVGLTDNGDNLYLKVSIEYSNGACDRQTDTCIKRERICLSQKDRDPVKKPCLFRKYLASRTEVITKRAFRERSKFAFPFSKNQVHTLKFSLMWLLCK